MARPNLVPCDFVWEKGKAMDFSETFVLYDIKVGKCSYVNEFMIETWYVALGAQVLPSLFK